MKRAVVLLMGLFVWIQAQAQSNILAAWDFYGLPASPNPAIATAVVYSVSAPPLLSKVGLGAGGSTNSFLGGKMTNSSLNEAQYFSFSLSNAVPITVSGLSMCLMRNSPSAPTNFTLRVSDDPNFNTYQSRKYNLSSIAPTRLPVQAADLNVTGTTVYFRLYGYGNPDTNAATAGFSGITNSTATINSGLNGTLYDLIIYGSDGTSLSVTPGDGVSFANTLEGTFVPASRIYSVSNTTAASLEWTITHTQAWVTATSSGGTLPAGGLLDVSVSINSAADELPSGSYTDTLVFSNSLDSIIQTRSIELKILEVTNIAIHGSTRLVSHATNFYTCRLQYSDGTTSNATESVQWSLIGSGATLVDNALSVGDITSETTVNVQAVYDGITNIYPVLIKGTSPGLTSLGKLFDDPTADAQAIVYSNGYAYAACGYAGLIIFDVSNPTNPVRVGGCDTDGFAKALTLQSNKVFIADDRYGLQVVDVTDPASPVLAGKYKTSGFCYDIAVSGSYAYLAASGGGLLIFDVSNPASLQLVSSYTGGVARAYGIALDGNYAYVADYTNGLKIIDVSNPATPGLVGSFPVAGSARDVAVRDGYAYVAAYTNGLQIINVSNPSAPSYTGGYATNSCSGVVLDGDFVYLANENYGLGIVNVSNPSLPAGAGKFDDDKGVATGVFVAGGKAYVANGYGGMQIVDISAPAASTLLGSYDTHRYAYDVAVKGSYAYLAAYRDGLITVDISNPDAPVAVATNKWATSPYAFRLDISGDTLYVAASGDGLVVYNLSNPAAPSLVTTYDFVSTGNIRDVKVYSNYAFCVNGSSSSTNTLGVVNVSDPAHPVYVGGYKTGGSAYGIDVQGQYAYLASDTNGLQVFDISIPASPILKGAYRRGSLPQAGRVSVYGNYAYVLDNFDVLQIIDIQNPESPMLRQTLDLGTIDRSESDIFVQDTHVYIACGVNSATTTNGLWVVDVGDMDNLIVTNYPTSGYGRGVAVSGGYIYLADDPKALHVFTLGGKGPAGIFIEGAPQLVAHSTNYYTCQIRYTDGSTSNATDLVQWSLVGGGATLESNALSVGDIASDSTVTIQAVYGVFTNTYPVSLKTIPYGILAAWDFYGLSNPSPIAVTASVYTVSQVPVLSRVGLSAAGSLNRYIASGFPTNSLLDEAVSANKYFEFSLKTDPVAVTDVSMCIYRNGPNAPTGFTLRVSSDPEFGSGSYTDHHLKTGLSTYNNWAISNLNVSGSTVYFRLYGYGAKSTYAAGFAGTSVSATNPVNSGVDGLLYDLIVYGYNGAVSVTPTDTASFNKIPDEPFQPASRIYSISNTTGTALNWTTAHTQPWVTVTPPASTLAWGSSSDVEVSINSAADELPAGIYTDTLVFSNSLNSTIQTRSIELRILKVTNIVIQGSTRLSENSTNFYDCRAQYSDGTSFDATDFVRWSLIGSGATLDRNALSVGGIAADSTVSVQAVYDGFTNSYPVTLKFIPPGITSLGTLFTDPTADAQAIVYSNGYAYVACGYAGVIVFDVSNSANPVRIGGYDTEGAAAGLTLRSNLLFVADGNADLSILNVTTPSNPTLAGRWQSDYDSAYAGKVAVSGQYAYLATTRGLLVLDISNIAGPRLVAEFTEYSTVGAQGIAVDGNYAYMADSTNGLKIFDISIPTYPVLTGFCPVEGSARDVAVRDGYAYVAAYTNGLQIINVSNKTNPVYAGRYVTNFVSSIVLDGDFAYLANQSYGIGIVNINNPSVPVGAGKFDDDKGVASGVFAANGKAYVANGYGGMQVVDISAPATSTLLGSYDTHRYAYDVAVKGSYAYLAANRDGLITVDISNPDAPVVVATNRWVTGSLFGYGLDIVGDYIYVAPSGGLGLIVYDISNPALPLLVTTYDFVTLGSIQDVKVYSNYAFCINSATNSTNALAVINVSTPGNPAYSAGYNTGGAAYGIDVQGPYAYLASGTNGLQIFDISNPSNIPVLNGSYIRPPNEFETNSPSIYGVAVSGDYAYLLDSGITLEIVDVSDRQAPRLAGLCNLGRSVNGSEVFVQYPYVFIAYNSGFHMPERNGLWIIDVSDPANPVVVADYPTSGFSRGVTVNNGHVYLADDPKGLHTFTWGGVPTQTKSVTDFVIYRFSGGNRLEMLSANATNNYEGYVEYSDRSLQSVTTSAVWTIVGESHGAVFNENHLMVDGVTSDGAVITVKGSFGGFSDTLDVTLYTNDIPSWRNIIGSAQAYFSSEAITVDETAGSVVLPVFGGSVTGISSVAYWVLPGTATAGSDYTPPATQPQRVVWTNTLGSRTITIPIKTDTTVEDDETFYVLLGNPINCQRINPSVCKVTITDVNRADTLADALDNVLLTWTTGGTPAWVPQSAVTAGGEDAAASGAMASNKVSYVQTSVTGAGTLSFAWSVAGKGTLRLYDGKTVLAAITNAAAWQNPTFTLTSNITHTLKWEFTQGSDSSGRAYLDQVAWMPASKTGVTVTAVANNPAGGTVMGTGIYYAGAKVPLNAKPLPGWLFTGWTPTNLFSKPLTATQTLMVSNNAITVTANFTKVPVATGLPNPPEGGAVTGSGRYTPGVAVSLTAASAAGFGFKEWTDGAGISVSTSKVLKFIMPSQSVTYTANFMDIQKPVVAITLPTVALRVSNAVYTAKGTASDNSAVTGVLCRVNSGEWTKAVTTNGWKNWSAPLTLIAGSNLIQALSVDSTGNGSLMSGVACTYVVYGNLTIQTNGVGTVTCAPAGMPEINKSYTLTAAQGTGSIFSNWTGDVTTSTNKSVTFKMTTNMTIAANFIDIAKPTVTITAPTALQRVVTNGLIAVRGTATDNKAVSNVLVQLIGGIWTNAVTTNGWKNWSAEVTVSARTNTIRAYSMDATGNGSSTSSVTFTFVEMGNLTIQTNGPGTVTRTPATTPELGVKYTITAASGTGYTFLNWTYGIGGDVATNKSAITFMMPSNLVLTANFMDTQKPVVTITSPTVAQRIVTDGPVTVRGTAADNGVVTGVVCRVNSGAWMDAVTTNGWKNWSASAALTAGSNLIEACSVDSFSISSAVVKVSCTYVVPGSLTILTNGLGTVTRTSSGALEIGKACTLTAAAGTGSVFLNWTGDVTSTNKAVTFLMASNMTITANFIDIQKPTVTITSPSVGLRVTNAAYTVQGVATDNRAVTAVMVQLNSNDWVQAFGTNNWSIPVTLIPGVNTIRAYSIDAANNGSITSSVSCTYTEIFDLGLSIVGLSEGARLTNTSPFVLRAGVTNLMAPISSLTLFANGRVVGEGQKSPHGEWAFADGAHLSVMGYDGDERIDYHSADTRDPFFLMKGTFTSLTNFSGSFMYYVEESEYSGAVNVLYSPSEAGQLTTIMTGDEPLGNRILTDGVNESNVISYGLLWNAPAGNYSITACAVYNDISVESAPVNITVVGIDERSYTYTTNSDNTINITGYTESDSEIVIPGIINGLPVTSIGGAAFSFSNLIGVTLPDSVISIGDYTFEGCGDLVSVTIGNGVTSIGQGAFQGCGSLAGITIPSTVTTIGDWAFADCASLMGIYFEGKAPGLGGVDVFYGVSAIVYRLAEAADWPEVPETWGGLPTDFWTEASSLPRSATQTMVDNLSMALVLTPKTAIVVDGSSKDWTDIPRSAFSYASTTQEVAVALSGNNIALLLTSCPFAISDTVLVYFKLRLTYGEGDNRHTVDLWTSGSVLYGMVDGQVIAGLGAVLLNGILEVKIPVEQAPSQVTIEEVGCGMDLGGGTMTELFRFAQP